MALYDDIARGLQGFGAGVQGRGPEFIQALNEDRKKAMVQDAFTVKNSLESGDIAGARGLVLNRLKNIEKLGGDPADTMGFLTLLDSGNIEGAISEANTLVNAGISQGLLKDPNAATIRERELAYQMQRDALKQKQFEANQEQQAIDNTLNQEKFDQKVAKEKADQAYRLSEQARQENKLSAGLEKQMLASQDQVVIDQRNSNKYDTLANDYERLNIEGGLKSTWSEFIKGALGTQDDVTEFKRNFNQVRISEGLKNLPPGPATDRDVVEAMKGVPAENASAETVASFLRGAAKLSRFNAGYNQFKADYIGQKRTGAGLNKAWRGKVTSPNLSRDITLAEIYATAQNRGMTPEEVAKMLGVEGGLF